MEALSLWLPVVNNSHISVYVKMHIIDIGYFVKIVPVK